MRVIGLSGLAGAGKTEAANYIERVYGFRRQHIATTLRKMLAELLRDNGLDEGRIYEHLEGSLKEIVIPEIGRSGRDLQITIGTEWGRDLVDDRLWVDTWKRLACKAGIDVMNDSVRFPNEEEAIRELRGFTILITRPGTGPVKFTWGRFGAWLYRNLGLMWGVHASERTDRLDPDFFIDNDGSLSWLYQQIDLIMADQGITKREMANAY